MVYKRTKVIDGRRYLYLVEGFRINGKVQQRVVKYLGPVKPVYRIKAKRKTNASLYARAITEKEKIVLENALHASNAFTRDRAKILLLSSEKKYPKQIAERLGWEARKVRSAVKSFNGEGLKALQRKKAKGAALKFSQAERKIILLHFSKKPGEFGYPLSAWTLPRFRKHLVEKQVVKSVSIETIRQMLKTAGASLNKSKRWQYSPDKNFLRKSRQ